MRVPHLARVPVQTAGFTASAGLAVPRAGRGAAAAFAPTDIAGLKLWLRADSLSLSDTDPVATWEDESGQNNDATQGTSGNRPVYRTAQQNSLPGVVFTASSSHFLVANGVSAVQSGSDLPYTVIYAMKLASTSTGFSISAWGKSDNTTQRVLLDQGSVFRCIRRDNANSQVIASATSTLNTSPHVIAYSFSGTAMSFYTDGAANNTGVAQNVGTLTVDVFSIGNHFRAGASSLPYDGTIFEMVVYDTELSSTDRGSVTSYLQTKWAI